MLKEFDKTLSGYSDPRLKKISWCMHDDPAVEGTLGFFDESNGNEITIISIPQNAGILGTFRPKSVKLIKIPIGIAGCGLAKDCPRETICGYIVFPLRIVKPQGEDVTLMDFFKAIYNFYSFKISEEDYVKLINLSKQKDRESFFNQLKVEALHHEALHHEKKMFREHWAGSMYFEGYDMSSRCINYGT